MNTNSVVPTKQPEFLICIHLTDGSVAPFELNGVNEPDRFWDGIQPTRLFAAPRLVLAGEHSKSVYVTTQIVRVDFIHKSSERWEFPGGYSDILELSEKEFRKCARLDAVEEMPKRMQPTQAGDFLVSFIKLDMAGGKPLYLMVEAPAKLPIENHSFMHFLLSKSSLHMRLSGGGMGVVNLGNLLGYTVYPGVPQTPADAWSAEPILDELYNVPNRSHSN